MVGYGTGGYGGLTLPWGGTFWTYPTPPTSLAAIVDELGIIQATVGAIAEEDNAIGGFEMTRLTSAVTAGDTTYNVESTLGWPASGKVALDGFVYYYSSKTLTTLVGITYIAGGSSTAGAAVNHNVDSAVTDISKELSALEEVRRAMLVEYAEGEDLEVIGRNLGVPRIPIFGNDAQYREIIKLLAYNPKGTILGIDLALEGVLGAGNYEIYEDLETYPNIVFVRIPSASLTGAVSAGKAFLTGPQWDKLGGAQDTLTVSAEPITVTYAKLKDLGEEFDFRSAIPSAVTYEYFDGDTPAVSFVYQGSVAEGAGVTQTAGLHTEFKSNAPNGTVYYSMNDTIGARVVPKSYVEISTVMQIPTGSVLGAGLLLQASLNIHDSAFRVRAGLENTRAFGLFATEIGGHLGSTVTLALDTWYEITVKKFGEDYVELWVDGAFIDRQLYSAFTAATANHQLRFGLQGTPSNNMEAWYKQCCVQVSTEQDYWNAFEDNTGTVNTANPTRFVLAASGHTFVAGDVGKQLLVYGSGASNPQGGNNNGRFWIATQVSGTTVTLEGATNTGADLVTANPTRITVEDPISFTYPDDLGKEIVISGSAASNDGTYVIDKILEPGTLVDFAADYDTTTNTEYSNICEVAAATFTSELDLSWQVNPVFVTEVNLEWEQGDASSFAATTLTLRQALWVNNLVMEIGYSDVLTGQLLKDTDEENLVIQTTPTVLYEYYPFYLHDPLGAILGWLDTITVGGVIPKAIIDP